MDDSYHLPPLLWSGDEPPLHLESVISGQVNGPFLAELNDEVLLQIMSPGKQTEMGPNA